MPINVKKLVPINVEKLLRFNSNTLGLFIYRQVDVLSRVLDNEITKLELASI